MIAFILALFSSFIFGILLVNLLKIDIFEWNNIFPKNNFKLQISQAELFIFILFFIAFSLSFSLAWKKLFFEIIFLHFLIFLFFVFKSTEFSGKLISKFKFFFYGLNFIMPKKFLEKQENKNGTVTKTEVQTFIDMGVEQGILEDKEEILLANILEFKETYVKEIMTPRSDLVTVNFDSGYEEIKKAFIESRHSRLIVIENSIDNIKGVIFLKDFFCEDKNKFNINKIIKEPYFVPETKNVSDLLREMQEKKISISIVVNEYGGTLGIVTIEDLITELIGEIEEEQPIPKILCLVPGKAYSISGSARIEEVEEKLGIEIEKGDYETLAGFIIHQNNLSIPESGKRFKYKNFMFDVESADEKGIYRIIARKEDGH